MNPGELDKRITFQRKVATTNENGFEVEILEDFKTVWAKVTNLHGREYFEAAAVQAENIVKFTIRYLEGIDSSMKILFQGREYNIIFVDNIKYKNRYMEIKAQEVDKSG